MRVAIIGMGAIGQVIERALAGRVDLVRVDRTSAPPRPDEPAVDAAVVCVKTPGTAWAAEVAARLLAPDGVAVTIQNGLGNLETLAARVGPDRAAVGVIYVGARLDEQGTLRTTGPGRLKMGSPRAAGPRAALESLATRLADGGLGVQVVDDPWPSVWRKLVSNAALNPTTALLGRTNGQLLDDPAGARVADVLAREVARVATSAGVAVDDEEAPRLWRETALLTATNRSSMLQDVEAGRVTEIDAICGAVVREGERRGVPAPMNQAAALLVSSLRG